MSRDSWEYDEQDDLPVAGPGVTCPFTTDMICYAGCQTQRDRQCIVGDDMPFLTDQED